MNVNLLTKPAMLCAIVLSTISCKDETATIGQTAPEIAAYDLQGNPTKLNDWKGSRLLTFWSGTCGVCVAELKALEDFAEKHPNKVQLIAINVDGDKADIQTIVNKQKLIQPIIKDQMGITAERYNLIGTPTSYVIDTKGNITAKYEGRISEADLEKLFTKIAN